MVLFFLPWAMHQAAGRETLASAAFAAIGMCLKPHFICLPLAVSALNCLQARSLRPVLSTSTLVFLSVGLAYVGYVRLVHPAYLTDIVGTGLAVYGAFGSPPGALLTVIGYPLGLVTMMALAAWRSGWLDRTGALFLTLALGGLGSYALQGTGFSYHKVPFIAFGMIFGCVILVGRYRLGAALFPVAIGLAGLAATGLQQGYYDNRIVPVVVEAIQGEPPVGSLITLTTNMYSGPAVAMALGADWASSYPSNWMVPGAVNRLARTDCAALAETCAQLSAIAARNRTANITDIARLKPDLIVVDLKAEHFDQPGFDWLNFMAADPAWSPVFAGYRQIAWTDRFLFFLRKP
jgi:hypothetical protein